MDLSTKDEEKNMKDNFIFDEDGHTVWIIWDKEKENEKKKSLANILDSIIYKVNEDKVGVEIGFYYNPEEMSVVKHYDMVGIGSVDFEGKFHIKHMMSTLLVSNCVQQIK